jgi:hypothetical protein
MLVINWYNHPEGFMPKKSSTKIEAAAETSMLYRNHYADGLEYLKVPEWMDI